MSSDAPEREWLGVIGRSLAFLCLVNADLRDKGLVPQATLLEALGLTRREAARLLGTTDRSLSELVSRAKRSRSSKWTGGGKRGKKRGK